MLVRRWLLIACGIACGDNLLVDEPADTRGGDRLDVYWYEMEGGGRERVDGTFANGALGVRLFDRERDEDCDVLEWEDGLWRCTPGLERPEPFSVDPWPTTVFVDGSCTELRGLASSQREYFLHGAWIGERFVTSALVRSGIAAEPGEYFELHDGKCVGPLVGDGGRYLWPLEGGVPGSALVAFSRDQLASTDRLGHEALVGADGTRVRIGFYDHELETPCSFIYGAGDYRCAPNGVEVGRTFADAACTRPAVADATPATRFAFEVSYETGCETVWELGVSTSMAVFEIDQGICIPVGSGEYRAGTPVSLAEIEVSLATGTNRVVDWLAAGAPIAVFDTTTQTTCSVLSDYFEIDGSRCMPEAWSVGSAFRDADCSQPVEISPQPAQRCSRVGRFATRDFETYAQIGERLDGLYTLIDDLCVPLVPRDGYAYHTLGDEVPREAFARATLVHAR